MTETEDLEVYFHAPPLDDGAVDDRTRDWFAEQDWAHANIHLVEDEPLDITFPDEFAIIEEAPLTAEGLRLSEIPHTFVVSNLGLWVDGKESVTSFKNVRVIVAHGYYDNDSQTLKFLDGQGVARVVRHYNDSHKEDPIRFVAVCAGGQRPVVSEDGQQRFSIDFYESDSVALPVGVNSNIQLENTANGLEMNIMTKVPDDIPGYVFLDKLTDLHYGADMLGDVVIS